MRLDEPIRVAEDVIFDRLGEEMVLLHLDRGIYFGLNPVGTRIWELLTDKGTLGAVLEAMQQEYEADPETLQRDLVRLAEELRAQQLILVGEDGPSRAA